MRSIAPQLGLPMKAGRPATHTHDYERDGTTTLFAALNALDGTVFGRNMQRHRHQEFIRFLNVVEAAVPAGKVVHAILHNYALHKHPRVRRRLGTPSFFAKLAKRRLKRGVFRCVVDLQAAINRFITEHNQTSKPFVWRADPDAIIAARKRGFQA